MSYASSLPFEDQFFTSFCIPSILITCHVPCACIGSRDIKIFISFNNYVIVN